MKIGIVGLGYVGLVTAVVLADQGHQIIGVDVDRSKISSLNNQKPPIFEPGLEELLKKNANKLQFTDDYRLLADAYVVFVCVSTPNNNGKINLDYVYDAIKSLKEVAPTTTIAVKSTVIPRTAYEIFLRYGIEVVSNPEFLREGSAIHDTVRPDRIVVGGPEDKIVLVKKIWEFTGAPIVETTNENAELIKYASNAFLAVKISFINELANLCERIPSGDVDIVAKGMGLDARISPYFLRAGLGFGGSCFPKDTVALTNYAREIGEKLEIVESAIEVNRKRVDHSLNRIEELYGSVKGKNVCILGLTFKDNTDDVRSSKSFELATELLARGAKLMAYDPVVTGIELFNLTPDPYSCLNGSDLAIISTEWNEFDRLDFGKCSKVIDLRRVLTEGKASIAVGRYGQT